MEQSMLRCEGLRKSYGDREAVKGVSFSIAEGECYGLLGPNGAGKTTTISMLCGLIIPDQGEVTVDGFAGGTPGGQGGGRATSPRTWPSTPTSPPSRT